MAGISLSQREDIADDFCQVLELASGNKFTFSSISVKYSSWLSAKNHFLIDLFILLWRVEEVPILYMK